MCRLIGLVTNNQDCAEQSSGVVSRDQHDFSVTSLLWQKTVVPFFVSCGMLTKSCRVVSRSTRLEYIIAQQQEEKQEAILMESIMT